MDTTSPSSQKVFEPFQFNYNITNYYCCCHCSKDNKPIDVKVEPKVFQKFFTDESSNINVTSNTSIINNSNKIIDYNNNKKFQYRKFNAKKYLDQKRQNPNT